MWIVKYKSCSSDCKRAHTSKVLLAHLKRKQKIKNEVSLLQPPPDCLEVIKVIQNVVPGTQGDRGQNTSMCAQAGGYYGFLASLWIASLISCNAAVEGSVRCGSLQDFLMGDSVTLQQETSETMLTFAQSENWPLDLVINTLKYSWVLVFWCSVLFCCHTCTVKKQKQDPTHFCSW